MSAHTLDKQTAGPGYELESEWQDDVSKWMTSYTQDTDKGADYYEEEDVY